MSGGTVLSVRKGGVVRHRRGKGTDSRITRVLDKHMYNISSSMFMI